MVTALDSRTRGPGLSPGRGHCVVCLRKTLYSLHASLHPYTWGGLLMKGFSVIIDWSSIDRYHQYRLISIYRLLFSIDWRLRDMFMWVPFFLLSAWRDLKLHYISIRNGGSLSCILALSTHEHVDSSFALPVGKETAAISAKQRLTVDRYITDSRPIHWRLSIATYRPRCRPSVDRHIDR